MAKQKELKQRSRGYFPRNIDTREPRKKFLIVCEGGKTEPNYFEGFRVNKSISVYVRGLGCSTITLVRRAVELKTEEYDEVWCVFDRDSFDSQGFNAAFDVARSHDIEIAYSNEAFELWYLLHFNYYDGAIPRKDYESLLSKLLGCKYDKSMQGLYHRLKPLQPIAIRNAKRLYNSYNPCNPERDNPSTTVFKLVERLNENAV